VSYLRGVLLTKEGKLPLPFERSPPVAQPP